jgi:hypothetical protein
MFSRDFFKCGNCSFIFVNRGVLLDQTEEKKRYDSHNNHDLTDGYAKFLNRLITIVDERFGHESVGLDFGSGPYPMLMRLLSEKGYKNLTGFDPYYNNETSYQEKKYDFITMCEVFEHVYSPLEEFKQLIKLLKPEGALIISTGLFNDQVDFKSWYYPLDETHINFFGSKSLKILEKETGAELVEVGKDLVIFLKK